MKEIIGSIHAHPVLWALAAYYVFAAAVRSMPKVNGSPFYRWLYGFTHLLACNLDLVAAAAGKPIATKVLTADEQAENPKP